MSEVALRFKITADTAQGMAAVEKLKSALAGMGAEAKDASDKGRSGMDGFGATITKVGGILAAYGIGRKLLDIGASSIRMGMDAVESENLFSVSMGGMAGAARQWSVEMSRSLGLNQYELRKSVGMFNQMFLSMGLGTKGAYDMSTGLVKLAHDMASFYNLRPEEAFEKLQAGITGEMEPLKRLGILVDEDTVKHYAYKAGIAAVGEQLTNHQKVLARYGTILEQTTNAQGDLERTADSAANALRRLGAQTEELQTSVGMAAMPALESLLKVTNDWMRGNQMAGQTLKDLAAFIALPVKALYHLNVAYYESVAALQNYIAEVSRFGAVAAVLTHQPASVVKEWQEQAYRFKMLSAGNAADADRYREAIEDLNQRLSQIGAAAQSGAVGVNNLGASFDQAGDKAAKALEKFRRARIGFLTPGVPWEPLGASGMPGAMDPNSALNRMAPTLYDENSVLNQYRSRPSLLRSGEYEGSPTKFKHDFEGGLSPQLMAQMNQWPGIAGEAITWTDNLSERFVRFQETMSQTADIVSSSMSQIAQGFRGGGLAAAAALTAVLGMWMTRWGTHMISQGMAEVAIGMSPLWPNPAAVTHGAMLIAKGSTYASIGAGLAMAGQIGGAAASMFGQGGEPGSKSNPVYTQSSGSGKTSYELSQLSGSSGQNGGLAIAAELAALRTEIARLKSQPAGVVVRDGVDQNGGVAPLMSFDDMTQVGRFATAGSYR